MKATIYYYTGTGNSLWSARKLSDALTDTQLVSITNAGVDIIHTASERIGLIFPVHIWGLPSLVIDFVNRLEIDPSKYYFAVAVNAGQVAATLIQLQTLMQTKGLKLSSGFSLNLPSNYIPWGGAVSPEAQQKKFHDAIEKINLIAATIKFKETKPLEKGPLWQNIFLSLIYRQSYNAVRKMDKSFWADDKCNNCAICEKICPAQNILIKSSKPVWQHSCDQCFACLQWCPEEAIQYGKNTSKKKRYRHPEVKLSEMLACVPAKK
ncbi:MAG: EFR1 family ferrodoxin [Deltaproteobacteria bacterium]